MTKAVKRAPLIRVFNVKYSPNLGDGLLSECLEAALIGQGADAQTSSIDLAARNAYGDGMAGRGKIMMALDLMPGVLRHQVVRAPLALASRRRWQPHYKAGLSGAVAAVIGGGNLLSDHDLNFPTKLALALSVARAQGIPVALYACGMAEHWTTEGDRRLRRALQAVPLRAVFLRDAKSCARWDSRFAEVTGQTAQLVRDPGLLAAETYGAVERSGSQPCIGLGFMSHIAIRYHANASQSATPLADWYVALAKALLDRGAHVIGFTNGAPEDRRAADEIAPRLGALGVTVNTPQTPAALSQLMGGCDAIVAYRMHAIIAAYSHAVPALALRWDDKVDAFMGSVHRGDWMADTAEMGVETAADRLMQAARDGLDPSEVSRVAEETRQGVAQVLRALH